MLDLKAALQKVEEEVRRAKEEAQLIREAAEAEKKAAYQLGAEETEARLSWAHALDAAGIPADGANCRGTILMAQSLLVKSWSKRSHTMNFCRVWAKELGFS